MSPMANLTIFSSSFSQHHLETSEQREKCVLFLVDRLHLVDQQLDVFRSNLPSSFNCAPMSGENTCQVGLKQQMKMSKVIVLTAQILLNKLRTESAYKEDVVSLSDISLLIFDECHNTAKNHPYNRIMMHYFEQKFGDDREVQLPQVTEIWVTSVH